MILGVGIDMVNIQRIAALLAKFPEKFEAKVFSVREIKATDKFNDHLKARYYAKRFAAKEAFSKAIGLGIGRGVNFTDIEIINNQYGKPEILLNKKIEYFLQNHFKKTGLKINLSLCDEMPFAQAIVIISA